MKRRTSKPKPRPQLDASRIAAAALAMADEKGLDALSFRNLAKVLGCEAMSLYHYFPSKAHLLDAMVGICLTEVMWPGEHMHWSDKLRFVCHQHRLMALRHPGFFQFMSLYRMNSREGLSYLDHIVRIIEETGLPAEARARQFRIFGYYVTGASLDEALGYARGPSAANPVPPETAREMFPAIMNIGPYFAREQHLATFDVGLEALIQAIKREVETASNSNL